MATKAMTLVGLDVHARQAHAAILDLVSAELRVSRLRMPAVAVAELMTPSVARAVGNRTGPTLHPLRRLIP